MNAYHLLNTKIYEVPRRATLSQHAMYELIRKDPFVD